MKNQDVTSTEKVDLESKFEMYRFEVEICLEVKKTPRCCDYFKIYKEFANNIEAPKKHCHVSPDYHDVYAKELRKILYFLPSHFYFHVMYLIWSYSLTVGQ